jgi:hypothetical protein
MGRRRDITGQRFGRLVALYPTGKDCHRNIIWRLRCDCGEETESRVIDLSQNKKLSCNCLKRERAAQLAAKNRSHGGATRNRSSLYKCWTSIKTRCLNPKSEAFKYYGGRGITIAPEWIDDFSTFRDYIFQILGPKPSPQHTIDRIDNDGDYEPGNLRWAPKVVQSQNSRGTRAYKRINEIVADALREYVRPGRQQPFKRVY